MGPNCASSWRTERHDLCSWVCGDSLQSVWSAEHPWGPIRAMGYLQMWDIWGYQGMHWVYRPMYGNGISSTVVPLDSNTLWLEHFPIQIHLANIDLQSELSFSIRTQTHVVADAAYLPVSQSPLHFSAVNTSLYCDSLTAFKLLRPLVASITRAPKPGHFLPTNPVNVAFYSAHWQTYILMKIYLTL